MKKTGILAFVWMLFTVLSGLAQNTAFRGRVVDDQGAFVVGASVTFSQDLNAAGRTKTTKQGAFELPLAPGDYLLEIAADDFASFSRKVHIEPNMAETIYTINLAPVSEAGLRPDGNLTATVVDPDFIQQFPDDPDELTQYLTNLAGPRANAAAGVDFIVDRFFNGVLPSKDQIRQVRTNTNGFTTEYPKPGFGRIEIAARSGAGGYHGNIQFNFRDQALDANSSLLSGVAKPPYQRRNYLAAISGPAIRDRLTLSIFANREDDNPSVSILALDPLTGLQDSGFSVTPSSRNIIRSRGQWNLRPDRRHVLNFNLEYGTRDLQNQGVGGIVLASSPYGSSAYNVNTGEREIQLREMDTISSAAVHETRFEFDRNTSNTNPVTPTGPTYIISGVSQFGSSNNLSQSTTDTTQIADVLSYSGRILTLRTGVQAEHFSLSQLSQTNFNGTYTYLSFAAFAASLPSYFTLASGLPAAQASEWTVAPFVQSDWKLSRRLLISAGARYQAQTNLSDYNDIDPRVALAYQLTPSTVVRGGFGTFHQTLPAGNLLSLVQNDGMHQLHIVIANPSYPVNPGAAITGFADFSSLNSVAVRAADLRTPYTINSGFALEQTLGYGLALTGSFDDIKSVHLYRGRDINAPLPATGVRPNPALGIVDQLESSADARFDSLTLGFRERKGNLDLFGNYSFSSNYNDTDGAFAFPSNNYNLRSDWGLSTANVRHRIQTLVNYQFPMGLLIHANIAANSGHSYDQVLVVPGPDGQNLRAAGVARNSLTGPGALNVNLNVDKTFVLREGSRLPSQDLTMTLFAQTLNVINRTNLVTPSGVLGTPFYGAPASKTQPRIVEAGFRFNF